MKRYSVALLSALVLWFNAAGAQRVDDFVLLDQEGAAHKLYYLSDKKFVVIMVQGNGCPIVRAAWPTFREIRNDYADKGVAFLMLNANLQDDRSSIRAEANEFGYDIPILDDESQVVAEALGVVRTAEVFVIETGSWNLVYRGPIDDRLTYERQRDEATESYLTDVLDDLLAGRPAEVAERDAVGCLVYIPHRDSAPTQGISYSEQIVPILEQHCVECHREGGIAPWAMSSYRMILGFSPMIREVVRTRRMPPWHADPHIGAWEKDRSLTPEEVATLVHWVEAGAPRGDGPDPLADVAPATSEWTLGEPDLVITLPAFEIPATGVVEYQYPYVANPLDEAVWVRAVALIPGDSTVVHHVLAGYTNASGERGISDRDVFENYLYGYAPGMEAYEYPDDAGVLIEPGGGFAMQVHYTPTGKATTDVTRIGVYFHDEAPVRILRNAVALNPQISIEPFSPAHEETAYIPFDKDAIVYSLLPHAHYRGKSSKFELELPDGRIELLLSVPNYDFNWQRDYVFVEPLEVPAGSKLIHTTVYDNSAQNPGNPDPSRRVPWGQQSWDEMLYGSVRFRWKNETVDQILHDPALARTQQMYGYSDRNRDGQLALAELPPGLRNQLEGQFPTLDRNNDGLLSIEEFSSARFGAPQQQRPDR